MHLVCERPMSKQPFPYKESLPLSVHYRDLQASSMGHLFYTHGNPAPEFMRDNSLKKTCTQESSIRQGMIVTKRKGIWNFTKADSPKKQGKRNAAPWLQVSF